MRRLPRFIPPSLLFTATLLAGDISITSLSLPMFDETGRIARTLKAESALGPLERFVLKSGVLEFHSSIGEQIAPGSTLTFDEAVYDKAGGFIEGAGPVLFASAAGDISGVGFHHDLTTGRLKLHREVLFVMKGDKHQGVKIRGDKADVVIRQNPSTRTWEITEALVTGPVVATDVTIQKVRFDRAETDRATYSAAEGTITLASPVTGWRGEEKTVLGAGLIQYQLDAITPAEAPAVAPPPTGDGGAK